MNRKNFRMSFASLIVFVLVGVMFASAAVTAFTDNKFGLSGSTNSAINAETATEETSSLDYGKLGQKNSLKADDKIGYIVEVDDTSLIDVWLANPQGYETFAEFRSSTAGKNAAENLINKQTAIYNKIARQADVKLTHNYVNIMNAFAIEITYGDRELINSVATKAQALGGYVSERYMVPDEGEAVENAVNAYDTGIFNSEYARKLGYAGQNTVVAILDTGLDYSHVAFDPNHPLFDLKTQQEKKTLKLTKDEVEKILPQLDAVKGLSGREYWEEVSQGDIEYSPTLAIDEVYHNEKVVYTYDYADRDPEVASHIENAHGTHVAGIIAGHSDDPFKDVDNGHVYFGYKKDGEKSDYTSFYAYNKGGTKVEGTKGADGKFTITVDDVTITVDTEKDKREVDESLNTKDDMVRGITGVAPQAQLAIFKVFSDFDSGAPTDALYAALEDCVTLGVDVINMSLGSDCGFQEEENAYRSAFEAYEKVGATGISLIVAASNSYSSAFSSHYGLNLTSNPDSATVGAPATFDAALAVASISGVKSKYLLATDGNIGTGPSGKGTEYGVAYYYESVDDASNSYDFIEDLYAAVAANHSYSSYIQKNADGSTYLKVPYVTLPGVGDGNSYVGKNVAGKIVLVARGDINFEEKIQAAKERKALGCIVFNNAAGMLRMQVGDDVGIPSCAISMDAAAKIKDKDATGNAYLIIDRTAEAGPFISEFSSWGPLPNLLLKPEITAHGGDIYSAIPGDETAYARFSGTSMACPNMAGVVALLRQYMRDTAKGNVSDKFGIMKASDAKANDKVVDEQALERRIYQILMSTATIAKNEDNNPYSPRKQGAGLADLTKSLTTNQYLYVTEIDENKQEVEKERTKLELLDDPEKTGEYEMSFYVKNVSTEAQTYKLNGLVFTEGISTDGKTVNEKARMLDAYTPSLTIQKVGTNETRTINFDNAKTSEAFQVGGNETYKITYKVTLGQADRDYLANFQNGMYVEGYVCLDNQNNEVENGIAKGIDLNVPFLAFYGDWGDAPIIDYDMYETTKDLHDDNIDEDDKRYSASTGMRLLGQVVESGTEYSIPLGSFIFTLPEGYDGPDATEDKCAISVGTNGCINGIWCANGMIRGAKRVFWKIEDALTGEIITSGVYNTAKKSVINGGSGGAWIDISTNDYDFKNNAKYTFSMYPVIDWNCEEFLDITDPLEGIEKVKEYNINKMKLRCTCSDPKACIEDDNCADATCKCADTKIRYYWKSNFWVDSDAPFISDSRVRAERDRKGNISYFLDLYLTDNHYIQGMELDIYDSDDAKFRSTFDPDNKHDVQPLETDRNTTTLFTYNLTSMWDDISDGINYRLNNPNTVNLHPELGLYPTQVRIRLYDYAFNKSYYEIDLMELMEGASSLAFGDIGNYTEYGSDNDKVSVLYSVNDSVNTLNNGNYRLLNNLTLVPGQKFPAEKAVISSVTQAYTGWREDLRFSVSPNSVLAIDDETNEIYAKASGSGTVTVSSRTNPNVSATLNIKVLTEDEIAKYNIPVNRHRESTSISGLWLDENDRYLDAGASFDVEANVNPWFTEFDTDKYAIVWESDDETLATVKTDYATNKAGDKAVITANSSKYIMTEADGKTPKLDSNGKEQIVTWDRDELTKNNKLVWKDSSGKTYDGPKKFVMNNEGYTSITAIVAEKVDAAGTNVFEMKNDAGEHLFYYKKTINTASITVVIQKEFVVEGEALTAYHGGDEHVVLPDDLKIHNLAANLFYKRGDIKSLVLPEGLNTINYGSCAYMENLERVIFPSTLEKIDAYGFSAFFNSSNGLPSTRLMVADFSACTKPIQIGNYAFLYQRYLGVDLNNKDTHIVDDGGKDSQSNVVLIKDYGKIFDLKNVRTAGNYAFYDLRYIKELNLTGLRGVGDATFYGIGSYLKYTSEFKNLDDTGLASKYDECHTTLISGEYTYFGVAAFVGSGIGEIKIHSQRVSSQAFVGVTQELSDESIVGVEGDVTKKVTFTADHLIIETGAFAYSNIEEVVFEGSVDYIGDGAFVSSELKTVKFPDNKDVKFIGAQAFSDTKIEEITLPKGLETLSEGAFLNCDKLTKVTIDKDCKITTFTGEEFTAYGSQFGGCKITSIEVETGNNNFTSEGGVLYNKDKTKIICVPSNIAPAKSNGDDPAAVDTDEKFADEQGAVTLPSSVKTIGAYAFSGSNIVSIDLTEHEDLVIEYGAFYNCPELTKVKFPSSITEIPDGTFYNCKKLSTVEFANATEGNSKGESKLNRIGKYSFYGCAFTSINLPEMVKIETQENGKKVTVQPSIGTLAFAENTALTTFNWPKAVTKVDEGVFFECTNLNTINNTTGIRTIETQAFTLTSLEKAEFINARSIGYAAFAGIATLKSIKFDNVQTIDEYAFAPAARANGDNDQEIITVLGEGNGASVTISNRVKSVGASAFANQNHINTTLTLNSCTTVGDFAFYQCVSLKVSAPYATSIGDFAFAFTASDNSATNQAINGTGDIDISSSAFEGSYVEEFTTTNTTNYRVDNGVLYKRLPGGGLELIAYPSYKKDITEYTVLDGTVRIADYAFADSQYLVKINIPESVKSIGSGAFANSKVMIYNFMTLTAPELEAATASAEVGNDTYFWHVYNNFNVAFNYVNDDSPYRYKSVRVIDENKQTSSSLHNTSYTGGGFTDRYSQDFNMILCYPSNATGFNTFVWSNYFSSVMKTSEMIESSTVAVMDLIRALPAPELITLDDSLKVTVARGRFNNIKSYEQRKFIQEAGLVDVLEACEAAISRLQSEGTTVVTDVLDKIKALQAILPNPSELTLENTEAIDAIKAARAAYDALSDTAKATFDSEQSFALNYLLECEARLSELEGSDKGDGCGNCGSCGTVAFGSGNGGGTGGGTGLIIGLVSVLIACLAVVLLGRKKATSKK